MSHFADASAPRASRRVRMLRLLALPALVLLPLLAGATACGGGAGGREEIPDPATLPLPDPDLGEMQPALRERLEQAEAEVEALARRSEAAPSEVAEAFGELGGFYHIFDLLDAAATAYGNAGRLQPERYRWPYLKGLVHVDQGQLEAAQTELERALELRPESVPAWIRFGNLLLERNQPEGARDAFERALELEAGEAGGTEDGIAAATFGLGRAEAALGRHAAAVEHFERVLELQPQASVVHYPLSQAFRRLGRMEEAEEQLVRRGNRRVAFPDPPMDELTDLKTLTAFQVLHSMARDLEVPAEQLLGFALTHLGDVRGTVEPLERVIAEQLEQGESPERIARLHYAAGGILVNQGDDDRALEHFRSAVARDPELLDAWVKLGNALARTGRLEVAVEAFARALELQPGDRELTVKRATVLINLGRTDQAIAELRQLAREDPEDPTLRIRVAEALEAAGDLRGAEAAYREAVDAGRPAPAQAQIHRGYGAFLQRQGQFQRAVEQYRQALRLDQDLLGARRDLAAVLGHLGRFREAAEEYARVTTAAPKDDAARRGEALALILSGRPEAAVRTLEEGVAEAPDAVGLKNLLARLLAGAPEESTRDGARALELALAAYDAEPVPAHAETVAMAYAELGDFERAVEWQERLLEQLELGPRLYRAQERLELYEQGEPVRIRSLEDLFGG